MRIGIAAGVLVLASIASLSPAQVVDVGTIGVSLDFPGEPGPVGTTSYYRLAGQSVFFTQRTNGGTSGGPLDGVTSFDSATSVHEITSVEGFPETILTDYLRFGYFGVLETVVPDGSGGETVVDTSLIIATQFGFGEGLAVEDIFPTLTEQTLVNALVNTFDSAEFFAALDVANGNVNLSGVTGLTLAGTGLVRQGDSLTLYGFIIESEDTEVGDRAQEIGFIDYGMVRIVIPEPSGLGALALAGVLASRRRRS
jgi:hypothetical protein